MRRAVTVALLACSVATLVAPLALRIADVGPTRPRLRHGAVPPHNLPDAPGYRAIWNQQRPLSAVLQPGDAYVEIVERARSQPFVWASADRAANLRNMVQFSDLVLVGRVESIAPFGGAVAVEDFSSEGGSSGAADVRVRVEDVLKNDLNTTFPDGTLRFVATGGRRLLAGSTEVVRRAAFERVPMVGHTYLWGVADVYGLQAVRPGPFEIAGDRLIPMFEHNDGPLRPFALAEGMRLARTVALLPTRTHPTGDDGVLRAVVMP